MSMTPARPSSQSRSEATCEGRASPTADREVSVPLTAVYPRARVPIRSISSRRIAPLTATKWRSSESAQGGGWMAEADLASWFVSVAVEAYGDRVLARAEEFDTAGPQAVGRADDLLDELSPPAEDQEDDEPAELPAEFDHRNMARTGVAVLEHGLPALPDELTHRMAVPMAYSTARESAAVLFLRFHRHRRTWEPMATMATFTRQDGQWRADTHWLGIGFHDPFTDLGGLHGLGGEAIVHSGSSSGDGGTILHGIAAPAV